jgi:hypothetical protein
LAEEIRLDVVSVAHNRGLQEAARDMKGLRGESDRVADSFGETGDAAFDLDRSIADLRVEQQRLNEEFKRTGDTSVIRELKARRAELNELVRIAKETALPADDDGFGFDLGGKGMRPRTAMIASVVGLVVAASPAIGAAVAGAVTGAVGGLGVIGGVAAASKDPRLREAAKGFSEAISEEFFSSGSAFVGPAIRSLDILEAAFRNLHLGDMFAQAAPFVEDLAEGIAGFAEGLGRGFNSALARSSEIIPVLADGIAELGDGLGDMITYMAESKGAVEGLRFLFDLLGATARVLGATVDFLATTFVDMAQIVARVSGVFEDFFDRIGVLGGLFRYANDWAEKFSGTSEEVTNVLYKLEPAQLGFNRAIEDLEPPARNAREEMALLNDQIRNYLGLALSLDEATLAVEQGFADFKETLKENGKHWNDNTQASRNNEAAFNSQLRTIMAMHDSQVKLTGDVKAANETYAKNVEKLLAMAKQAGRTKKELEELEGRYLVAITVQTGVAAVANAISSAFNLFGGGKRRAAGGPMAAGESYLVGERGVPEVFTPRQSGFMHPSVPAFNRAAGGSSGGSQMRTTWIDGDAVVRALIIHIARVVQSQGGHGALLGIRA